MGVEKKGDSGAGNSCLWQVLEVAARKGLGEILGWVNVWWNAGRLTEGVALTTNEYYHVSSWESRRIGCVKIANWREEIGVESKPAPFGKPDPKEYATQGLFTALRLLHPPY